MAKHNYSQYSNKKRDTNTGATTNTTVKQQKPNVVKDEHVVKLVEETVETVALPEKVKGAVVNCVKLNVREEPNITSRVVTVLLADSEVEIDLTKSNDDWFSVRTAAGKMGYCMRKFVSAKL